MSEPVEIVRAADLVEADPTPGMSRFRAFEAAGLWAGRVETQPGAVSGWHHHDVNETSLYVVSGVLRLEFEGYDGHLDAGPGDFVHVPAFTVHRESNPTGEPSVAVIARAGGGIATVNVERPEDPRSLGRDRAADPAEIEQMKPAGRFVAEVLTSLAGGRRRRREPAGARRARARDDPGARRRVLLHRLPPVVRRDAVRQGAVHLGQRRGAARAPPRLRARATGTCSASTSPPPSTAGSRTPRSASWSARRPAGPRPDRHRQPGPRRRHRRRAGRVPDRGHLGRDRRGRPRGRALDQHRLRRSRRRPDHARRPARAERRPRRPRVPVQARAW